MSNQVQDAVTADENQAVTQAEIESTNGETTTEKTVESPVSEEIKKEDNTAIDTQTEEKEEEVKPDYSSMSKEELVEVSQSLHDVQDFRKTDEVLRELKTEIDSRNQVLREEALKTFVESGGEKESFKFTQDKLTDKFYENYKALKERKHKYFEDLEKTKAKNLALKQEISVQIKELTEQDITKEVSDKVKSLQAQWKEIGAVPQADADNLYKSYKALLDQFYAKKSMEHELIRLDREKNLKSKLELCEKAEALIEEENINEAVSKLNQLHQEYKATGHIPREKQEEVWQRFKKASDKIYDKKRAYVEDLKKKLEENMKVKQELCLKIETYADFSSNRITEWNDKTKEVLNLQKSWDEIGPVPREVAKTINKQFWGNFKAFFNGKHKFFEELEVERKENLKKKEALCDQVDAIKDSFDWNEVADKLKELQRNWKEIGPVPEAQRESIYQRFKAACDHFFDRKRNRRAEQDKEFAYNQDKKTKISAEIKALEINDEAMTSFEELLKSWFKVGFVPREAMSTVQEELTSAAEVFLSKTSLPENEKDDKIFEIQKQFLMTGGGRNTAKKEQAIRRKISNIENDIALWKNNLEFFASSKTADRLRDEFNTKIDKATSQLHKLKAQLRAFDQIRKQAEADRKSAKAEKKPKKEEATA